MAKRKDSAALFEVVNRSKDARKSGLRVPAWIEQNRAGLAQAPAKLDVPAAPLSAAPGERVPAPPAEPGRQVGQGEPYVSLADGRFRVNLSFLSCIVACLGLVVLLGLAYALGRWSVSRPKSGASLAMLSQGQVGSSDGYDAAKLQALATSRAPGHYFLRIVRGVPTRAKADAIQRFLWDKGHNTTVEASAQTKGAFDVVDLTGMTQETPQQEVRERIKLFEGLASPDKSDWRKLIGTQYAFQFDPKKSWFQQPTPR